MVDGNEDIEISTELQQKIDERVAAVAPPPPIAEDMSALSDFRRLIDPDGLLADDEPRHERLQHKLSCALTRMFQSPARGGNPFLFSIAGAKKHFLAKAIGQNKDTPIDTAATNGKDYFWNPDFLEELNENEVATVLWHETNHILFNHCRRLLGAIPQLAGICVDYSVNNEIEIEHEKSPWKKKPKLWGVKGLGNPLTWGQLLACVDGHQKLPKCDFIFCDAAVRNRSPESLYDELMDHWKKSPMYCDPNKGGCGSLTDGSSGTGTGDDDDDENDKGAGSKKNGTGGDKHGHGHGQHCCPKCGSKSRLGSLDSHIPSVSSREEVQADILKASEFASATYGAGSIPTGVEVLLQELKEPTLRPSDIIKNARMKFHKDHGNMNDYRRLRRRGLANNPPLYQWRKKDYASEWVAMIDTSGSMSDADIANGVKELKAVGGSGHGWIVPCDTEPYWDQKTEISQVSDIAKTKIVGRGGTIFNEFFSGLRRNFPDGFDTVVVITDGTFYETIPQSLNPQVDVVWIVTNRGDFTPPFGRVCYLDPGKP